MRVVLDTNVLVSGLLTAGGTCAQVVELMIAGEIQPCVDSRIMAEYEAVLGRAELGIPPQHAKVILDLIRTVGEVVTAMPLPARLPHVGDMPFLAVASTAGAILVTGNMRHFPRKACGAVPVVSPADLLDLLRNA